MPPESLRLVEADTNGYVNTLLSWYSEVLVGILGSPPLSGQGLIDPVIRGSLNSSYNQGGTAGKSRP